MRKYDKHTGKWVEVEAEPSQKEKIDNIIKHTQERGLSPEEMAAAQELTGKTEPTAPAVAVMDAPPSYDGGSMVFVTGRKYRLYCRKATEDFAGRFRRFIGLALGPEIDFEIHVLPDGVRETKIEVL